MKKKSKSDNTLLRGAAWLTLSTILLKIIGLIYKLPLSYILGDEGMGYFNSAYTVYIFFYIIGTAGIPKAISVLVSKSEAEQEGSGYAVFKTAFLFFFALGVVLLMIFYFSATAFAKVIGNQKSVMAMYSIAPSILFVCAGGVIRGYLSGRMKFAPIAISELLSSVFKLGIGLLLARVAADAGKSLPIVSAYTIFGITIGSFVSLIYLAFVYVRNTQKTIVASQPPRKTIGDILKIAIPITLASAIGSIVNILDLTLVMNGLESSGFDSSIANVLYGNYTTLAVPMLSLVSTLISPITTALLPLLASTLAADNRRAREHKVHLTTSFKFTSFITVPAFVCFSFFSKELLSIIFEEGSAVLGAPFLVALAPGVLVIGALMVVNTMLEATGKQSIALLSLLSGTIVKLILTVYLMHRTDLGILCAPIGTTASYLISYCISMIYANRALDIRTSVLRSMSLPFIASVIATPIAYMSTKYLTLATSARLCGVACALVFSTFYLASLLVLSSDARKYLLKCVKINKKRTNDL